MKPKIDIVLKIFQQFAVQSYTAMEKSSGEEWQKAYNVFTEELKDIGLYDHIDWSGE